MKVVITKSGKPKYKAADGLIFEKKEHCLFYEKKHMWKVKSQNSEVKK